MIVFSKIILHINRERKGELQLAQNLFLESIHLDDDVKELSSSRLLLGALTFS